MDAVFPGQDFDDRPAQSHVSAPSNLILKPGVILRISTQKKSTSETNPSGNYITVKKDTNNRVISVHDIKSRSSENRVVSLKSEVLNPIKTTSLKTSDDNLPSIQCNILRRTIKLNSLAKHDYSSTEKKSKISRQSDDCKSHEDKRSKEDSLQPDNFIHKHTGKMKFPCLTCGRNFKEKSQLEIHVRYHTEERPYKCLKCGKAYFTKGRLRSHHRLHLRDKRYKCMMCDKLFFNPSHLVRHSFVHAKDKPHQCEVCGRCFSQQSNLTRHLRVHTKEKPYQCTVCLKTFPRFDTLQRHQTIHFQKRYIKCSICQRLFCTADELTEHCAQHHKGNADDSSDDFVLQQ